jgi:hypothetical protein
VANTFFPEEAEPEYFKYMVIGGHEEKEGGEKLSVRERKFRRLEEDEDD